MGRRYLRLSALILLLGAATVFGHGRSTDHPVWSGYARAGLHVTPAQASRQPSRSAGPIVGSATPVLSPPLRDLPPGPRLPPGRAPEQEPTGPPLATSGLPDPVVQRTFGGSSMPSPIANFDGMGNIDGVYPPDLAGDVGPDHYVQMINSHLAVYDKSGLTVLPAIALNVIWTNLGGPCAQDNDGDPIVLYDQLKDRWLLSQFNATSPYGECIAVSKTGDPTGQYWLYFFQFSTTVLYDYPKLGVWPDGYYLSTNRFGSVTFDGATAIALERDKMLAGQPTTFQEFRITDQHTLLPADLEGKTLPPTGREEFFAELYDTTNLRVWKFHVDWTTPANSTLTGPFPVTVPAFNQLCPATRNCVDQPATTQNLDGLGDRLMHRLTYRNFAADHEMLLLDHAVDVAGGSAVQAGMRWYELRTLDTPSLFQSGTYAPDPTNRWMGSAAMDQSGDIALGYSASSSTVFPSIRYTGRLAGDAAGQLPQGEATLVNGGGAQTGTASRWGDYTTLSVDPDGCTFWYVGEYVATTGTANWRTRIGSFKFPTCGTPTAVRLRAFHARPTRVR